LLYQLKQGKAEESIIEQCIRLRRPLPAAIANAPELHMGLAVYYQAYCDLSTCRTIGMSPGPIPWTAAADYARCLALDEEQTEDLFFHVRSMDSAYLDYTQSKVEEARHATKTRKGFGFGRKPK
jgi:hypothetical protein